MPESWARRNWLLTKFQVSGFKFQVVESYFFNQRVFNLKIQINQPET
jgi:hypothetical protein